VREGLPWQELPNYIGAVLRVYNLHGRRDNLYKARIKILLRALGVEVFKQQVDAEYQHLAGGPDAWTQAEWERVARGFEPPAYEKRQALSAQALEELVSPDEREAFRRWLQRNVKAHQQPGHASVILSLKPHNGLAPGDLTSSQMRQVADLADRYSGGEIRATHEQNLVLADVAQSELAQLWREARSLGLATPNIGLLTDIIACPGGDFCSLANAKSIPIAQAIQRRFDQIDALFDLGDLSLNISGCINSCGHHHVGNIGILGVDKDGQEWYQVTLGGEQGQYAAIGKVIGPSFHADDIPEVIEQILSVYLREREVDERFIDVVRRLGVEPFKSSVYAKEWGATRAATEAQHV
jgi:sulfite reductase (NADPH) hemoprotein beta-component